MILRAIVELHRHRGGHRMNESVGSLRRRHCLPLPFGAPRHRHEVPVLEHLVLPDAGLASVGDTSPGFPLSGSGVGGVEPELPHPGTRDWTGFALVQLCGRVAGELPRGQSNASSPSRRQTPTGSTAHRLVVLVLNRLAF